MTTRAPSVDDTLRVAGFHTLGDEPPQEAVEAAFRALAESSEGCDELRREALRAGALPFARKYGWRAAAVDAVLGGAESEATEGGAGSRISIEDPKAWPEQVNGSDLLADLVATFLRFLGLPDWAPVVLALWVLHAHAHEAADVSPLLALTSPLPRCGKSTTLHVLGALVPRPLPASNITAAALFRAVETFHPTLLVDEADTFLGDKDELRGVLNSGHARAGAFVVRTVGDDHEASVFSTWAPKAVAMIGDLPDTLADRSLIVPMRRRRPDESVERLRLDRLSDLDALRRRAWRWSRDHLGKLRSADPDVPDELHDRAADNWRPLLAIADAIGGEWPTKARGAARDMSGADNGGGDSTSTLLLRDIRDLFRVRGADRLRSKDIVRALVEMEHRPWPEWGRAGKPLTTTSLARMLKPFDVKPTLVRDGAERTRGYDLSDLSDAFDRYLSADDPSPGRSTRDNPVATRGNGASATRDSRPLVTGSHSPEKPRGDSHVTGGTSWGEGSEEDLYATAPAA